MTRLPTLLAATAAAYLVGRALGRKPLDLHEKVVLITGGSRGLGLVLARKLARMNARLAIVARDPDELRRAEEELADLGARVLALTCDVADEADVRRAVLRTVEHYGRLDVLINNAAIISVGPLDSMIRADYERAMDVNFWGPLHFMLAVRDTMRGQGGGSIVNISSVGGKVPVPHLLPYSASKFALTGLSSGWRAELLKDGVVVTTVHPGLMSTGSPRNVDYKGRHEQEYAWFSLADNLPGLAQTPEAAADEIIDALRYGRAEIVTSVPAKVLATFHALFPGQSSTLLSVMDRFLPARGGIGTQSRRGSESETAFTRALGTKAAAEVAHNQQP
ncbi:SDR family NAD(P)-dependent oxidoreductase [Deinococcus pimensis]|uniref:SDR family NAD(P)-dependent oxidoreductase n=1 Tax=Deinococcus pimensis TaxID=309888 RepID=UPI000487AAA3|nr:SDR family oxidoreductase [Deinococcus pimensis]